MPIRALVFRLALAVLLLCAQQQATLHLLGHGLAELASRQGTGKDGAPTPHELLCEKCLAFAALDHAIAGAIDVPSAPRQRATTRVLLAGADPRRVVVAHYSSRAPPVLI